jgi:hypothetical protein
MVVILQVARRGVQIFTDSSMDYHARQLQNNMAHMHTPHLLFAFLLGFFCVVEGSNQTICNGKGTISAIVDESVQCTCYKRFDVRSSYCATTFAQELGAFLAMYQILNAVVSFGLLLRSVIYLRAVWKSKNVQVLCFSSSAAYYVGWVVLIVFVTF